MLFDNFITNKDNLNILKFYNNFSPKSINQIIIKHKNTYKLKNNS